MQKRMRILSIILTAALLALSASFVTSAESSTPLEASYSKDIITLDAAGHLSVILTEDDTKNLLTQTTGTNVVLDYSGIAGISGATVQLKPSWLLESGKGLQLTINKLGSVSISNAAWKEIANLAGEGTIELTIKKGSVIVSITQNGNAVDWYSIDNPMLISVPFNEQGNPDYAVIFENRGAEEPKHLIPLSWCVNGRVYALVHRAGEFGIQYMGKTVFNDTDGRWMDEAVNYLAARNVITGEEQGVFVPGRHITRAEFVSILMGMFDIQLQGLWMPRPYNDQKDVPQWASEAVLQATAMGILTADSSYNFHPNEEITRQDMFTITCNLMAKTGVLKMSEGGMVLREFNDSDKIADYAYMQLLTLVQSGLVRGSRNVLNPTQTATKAEIAQFLYNVLQYTAKKADKDHGNLLDELDSSQQDIKPAGSLVVSDTGDVTGDKIQDKILLYGSRTQDSLFIKDITLAVQDGKTGKSTDIFPKNNAGYTPTLFLGDFNGDGIKDILLHIDSGGSGAFTYDYIYSFAGNKAGILFSSDTYNNIYKYNITYKDGYKAEIASLNNNSRYMADLGYKGVEYLNGIYGINGILTRNINGFVNPLSSLFPVDTDQNGVYELLAFQKLAGLYNADSLGYVENFLKWENGEFVLYNQIIGIN